MIFSFLVESDEVVQSEDGFSSAAIYGFQRLALFFG